MKTWGTLVAVGAIALLALAGCAADPKPGTPEQKDCAAASPLLPELDKAQAGELSAAKRTALEKRVTEAIDNGVGNAKQVGAMLYVLRAPDDTETYYKFRAQLVTYCEDFAKWPIE